MSVDVARDRLQPRGEDSVPLPSAGRLLGAERAVPPGPGTPPLLEVSGVSCPMDRSFSSDAHLSSCR